ncbi:F-box/LRR-repeat protein 16 [Nothobranchius furzeri]|uniref:F-box/LRR-repeat protein 16 n=3 Tax=Nothobranchius TaxID=28779 RepID=A0A1A7ZAK5_NOTFU|nr:F-box/LRR-repeat protein 16 [Nothobranchius furzeri]XP_015824417.1 F-box/LRR-repeat protein 16 [Nothobranchius furzeri]KAF7200877.1 transcript variant X1 [Nothobranchius furzeri]KAF7200878.1 transcript variant X2 [Nothobranchius furzeri]
MLNMSTPSELKSPCVTRNGLVKLPPTQPNGLGSASITKGTPAAKNRICQSSSVPSILPPPPSSLPYHNHHHHLDGPGLPLAAAPLLTSDLEPGKPLVGLKPSFRQLPPLTLPKPILLERQLVLDEKLLNRLLWYFTTAEKCVLAQVCKTWRKVLYQPKFWEGVTPILHATELYNILPNGEKEFVSLQAFALRGFQSFCLVGVSDLDICEFIDNYPLSKKSVRSLSLKRSTITDAGLEVMLEQMQGLMHLELSGCNDFTEAGLWSSLNARLTSLSVSDCINVADDAIAAISQLLPNLSELSLQAYHVTDTAMAYFTAKQGYTTHTLRLHSCWEITNHGVVNMVHSLPNLTALSLSGCSKITDDGVELVAENLRKLRSLDLSWCPRITDMALEYIACDLHKLEELVLDRCVRVTDTGLGYLSTMASLRSLYLRWCCQVQDFGLQHLFGMRSLRLLSLAGCPLLTTTGLSGLIQLQELEELELTNCPGATAELFKYYSQHLPHCMVIE